VREGTKGLRDEGQEGRRLSRSGMMRWFSCWFGASGLGLCWHDLRFLRENGGRGNARDEATEPRSHEGQDFGRLRRAVSDIRRGNIAWVQMGENG
jgi:hypothetical protein